MRGLVSWSSTSLVVRSGVNVISAHTIRWYRKGRRSPGPRQILHPGLFVCSASVLLVFCLLSLSIVQALTACPHWQKQPDPGRWLHIPSANTISPWSTCITSSASSSLAPHSFVGTATPHPGIAPVRLLREGMLCFLFLLPAYHPTARQCHRFPAAIVGS
ncbi:hypothetical protein EI94DRAFT_242806 [Lactarius quietus]|nr:hypothetical protein EI94DRAFT_242806 [Lactarius quietus]